ncbi:MAG: hypothetical protein R2835_03620 [Thermomicrobiales bacterium]
MTLNLAHPTPQVANDRTSIPKELNAHSNVFELETIGDARLALARLRQLRHDFEAATKQSTPGTCCVSLPPSVPGKGEGMLAGLSNIQRLRLIRREIAYLEDLMVRIAEREFQIEEMRHESYLAGLGEWTVRGGRRPTI